MSQSTQNTSQTIFCTHSTEINNVALSLFAPNAITTTIVQSLVDLWKSVASKNKTIEIASRKPPLQLWTDLGLFTVMKQLQQSGDYNTSILILNSVIEEVMDDSALSKKVCDELLLPPLLSTQVDKNIKQVLESLVVNVLNSKPYVLENYVQDLIKCCINNESSGILAALYRLYPRKPKEFEPYLGHFANLYKSDTSFTKAYIVQFISTVAEKNVSAIDDALWLPLLIKDLHSPRFSSILRILLEIAHHKPSALYVYKDELNNVLSVDPNAEYYVPQIFGIMGREMDSNVATEMVELILNWVEKTTNSMSHRQYMTAILNIAGKKSKIVKKYINTIKKFASSNDFNVREIVNEILKKVEKKGKIKFKLSNGYETRALILSNEATYEEFFKKVSDKFGTTKLKLKFKDPDEGEIMEIQTQEDLVMNYESEAYLKGIRI